MRIFQRRSKITWALLVFFVVLSLFALWVKLRSFPDDGGLRLEIKWEGIANDKNFRDLATSINECYGQEIFNEGLLLRSNVWFSGWGCYRVGSPQDIYSLNYTPEREERYFCRNFGENIIGKFYNFETELYNLEFMDAWENDAMRRGACGFLTNIFDSLAKQRRTLIHCDAGRDRTGTVSTLIAALVAERNGFLDERMIDAIECDYRKSGGVNQDKYNRMRNFVGKIQQAGSVAAFLTRTCGVSQDQIDKVAQSLNATLRQN